MPHDAEVILGNSKGSKIEFFVHSIGQKTWKKNLEKFQKKAASTFSIFHGDLR